MPSILIIYHLIRSLPANRRPPYVSKFLKLKFSDNSISFMRTNVGIINKSNFLKLAQ